MKIKTKKSIVKRFSLSHPKGGKKGKVMHESPGFAHGFSKKRKFRVFRGKHVKSLASQTQSNKIIKELS